MSNYITAIDLGTTKIATIVGEKRDSEIIVVGYSEIPSEGIIKGEVLNIQKASVCIGKTLDEVRKQVGVEYYRTDNIYVGISIHNMKCVQDSIMLDRPNPSEIITQEEIEKMLSSIQVKGLKANEKVIHAVAQSYNIDDENMGVVDPVGMCGKEVTGIYKLFIGRSESTSNTDKAIHRLSLRQKKNILTPLASAKAILTKEDKELGVAMIDMGGGTTDLVIYKDNQLKHIAVLPIAGNAITEDIRQVCSIPQLFAERVKKEHGSALSEYVSDKKVMVIENKDGTFSKRFSQELLARTIEARLSEILATIYKEIESVIPVNRLGSGIVLTGGCANIPLIQYLAKKLTKMDVKIAFPDSTKVTSTINASFYNPKASTVIGLLLTAAEEVECEYEEMNAAEELPQEDGPHPTIWGDEEVDKKEDTKKEKGKKAKKNKSKGLSFGGLIDNILFPGSDEDQA